MYQIVLTKQFKRSFKKVERSGMLGDRALRNFKIAVQSLILGQELPASLHDHQLKGEWRTYRECHLKGDLLLVYKRVEAEKAVALVDIGSHSYIFG